MQREKRGEGGGAEGEEGEKGRKKEGEGIHTTPFILILPWCASKPRSPTLGGKKEEKKKEKKKMRYDKRFLTLSSLYHLIILFPLDLQLGKVRKKERRKGIEGGGEG